MLAQKKRGHVTSCCLQRVPVADSNGWFVGALHCKICFHTSFSETVLWSLYVLFSLTWDTSLLAAISCHPAQKEDDCGKIFASVLVQLFELVATAAVSESPVPRWY